MDVASVQCSLTHLKNWLTLSSLTYLRKYANFNVLHTLGYFHPYVKEKELKRLIRELKKFLQRNPEEAPRLEENSAYIFDALEQICQPRPEIRPAYKLLSKWGYFSPIKRPEKAIARLYGKLSFNAHEHISTLDVGRAMEEEAEIFEVPQPFLESSMREYLKDLQEVLSLLKTSEQNLLNFIP